MKPCPICPNLSDSVTFGRAEVSEMSERPLGLGRSDSLGRLDPHLAHRPSNLAALSREARRLAAQGLTPRDVGELLGIGTGAAAALLGAARTHHESHRNA